MYHLVAFAVLVAGVSCAPKSKGSYTTYDQKQTGDYNIQLHLKDFQIVALLGDDTLDSFGDYEYNYDYSDLTVKPPHNSSVNPPQYQPNSTFLKPPPPPKPTKPTPTTKIPTSTTTRPTSSISMATSPKPTSQPSEKPSSKNNEATTPLKANPGRIVVEIVTDNIFVARKESEGKRNIEENQEQNLEVSESVSEQAVEDHTKDGELPQLEEISHYRKCPTGFLRDKRGRCRKVRRPTNGIQYGLTRLATNLASKFRQAAFSEEDSEKSES